MKFYKKHIVFTLAFLIISIIGNCQEWIKPVFNKKITLKLEERMLENPRTAHTSVSQYLSQDDSLLNYFSKYTYKNKNYYIAAYPSFYIGSGLQDNLKFLSNNSAGININASYSKSGHNIGIHAGTEIFAGVQPYYLRLIMNSKKIVPGLLSNPEIYNNWNIAFLPDIYAIYQTPWIISLEAGVGKDFIGDGYRSLLLSENSSPYPYASVIADFDNISYRFRFMSLKNNKNQPFSDYNNNKFALNHYLNWNISDYFSLGIFESIVWTDKNRNLIEAQYLNPFIFFRPVEFSTGSSDNALMGLNLKIIPFKKFVFYSQFILDDIKIGEFANDVRHRLKPEDDSFSWGWFGNKYGGQLGIKYFDAFNIENLFLRTEFNAVRPFVYGHSNVEQSYSHNYQALAHPLESNFIEYLFEINYSFGKNNINLFAEKAFSGITDGNYYLGENIFYPVRDAGNEDYLTAATYGNEILQGERADLLFIKAEISRSVIENRNLELFVSGFYRKGWANYAVQIIDFGIVAGARTHPSILREVF